MDVFCGTELAFANTYFGPRPCVLKISEDAPVRTLTSTEVPSSAGSFSTTEGGLQNRFILWRADGSNLHLDEFSVDRDLVESSLCINFSQSLVVPGTRMFIVRHKMFLLVVPTQSGIHRFYVHLARHQDDSLGNYALISRLHEDGELFARHDFHPWNLNNAVAAKASIGTDKDGRTVCAVCMVDKQLLRVTFHALSPLMSDNVAEEIVLQSAGVFNRLFSMKQQNADCRDMTVLSDEKGGLIVYSVTENAKIRSFGTESASPIGSIELLELLPRGQPPPVDVKLKSSTEIAEDRADLMLIQLQLADCTQFVVLKQLFGKLVFLFTTNLDSIYVVDYSCTSIAPSSSTNGNKFCFWAIVDEAPKFWEADGEQEQDGQPYILKKCEFELEQSGSNSSELWENVRPATLNNAVDALLFNYPDMEAIKNRIFDGNNYSFDVVNRAIQIVCGQPKKQHFVYGNWIALSRYLDEFLASNQFKQLYLNVDEERDNPMLDYGPLQEKSKLRVASEKFWSNLLKSCNQLQEEHLKPLAIWHSQVPGLVGVIQISRFTVYCQADNQLRTICDPHDIMICRIFNITKTNMNKNLKDSHTQSLEIVNNHTNEFCRLIRSFIDCCLHKFTAKSFQCNLLLLNSSFTIGLISTALRNRILVRLRLAVLINQLIEIVPQILAISTESRVDPKLDMTINEHQCRISQIITYYTTMWIALSVRLVSQDPTSKQLNVAQAFLKYGGLSMLKRFSDQTASTENGGVEEATKRTDGLEPDEENEEDDDDFVRDSDDEEVVIDEDEMDERMEDEDEAVEEEQPSGYVPSRWDTPVGSSDQKGKAKSKKKPTQQQTQFTRFVIEMLDGIIHTLWPESSLTLPRFLTESKFFDALKSYCALNEPFPPELRYAFRFFQAIALSGQSQPDEAWQIFEEVAHGVVSEDDALDGVLSQMYSSPSAELCPSTPPRTTKERTKKKTISLVEYFNKVMQVYKEHKHAHHVIMAGERAIQFARNPAGIGTLGKEALALLLSEIYTTLFTQHLLDGNYPDAVLSILASPNAKRQSVSLRQLVTHLLDTRQLRTLVALPYDRLADNVVELLEARSKGEMVGAGQTPMYDITYAFHISRCEYGRAARLMYELAMRLRQEIQTRALLQRRCNALAMVYQTMQIAELCKETITYEAENDESGSEADKDFAMIDMLGREEQASAADADPCSPSHRHRVELKKADVARELLKAEARLSLLDADPMTVPPLSDEDILRESLRYKRYDMAWLLIKEFCMKPYELLEKVTLQAIHMDYGVESGDERKDELNRSQQMEEPDWVVFNRQYIGDAGAGGNQPSHWRIVTSYLDLSMELFPHDTVILRTVANTFLKFSLKLPTWLESKYKRGHFGDLLSLLIDFDDLADAFKLLLPQINVAKQRLKEIVAKRIRANPEDRFVPAEEVATLLPYAHITYLLQLAEKSCDKNLPINELVEKMKDFARYQKALTHNPTLIAVGR